MGLQAGTRLGPFEIRAAIGAGGMGEVYHARDTRLDRDVALKVLPDAFTNDAERLARFDREARSLAALNHPNIAQIYGVEESALTHALVMELAEGEDLSRRISRGPIPVAEALSIARQIADALDAAHEHGIVHRDLKPANIKVGADGTVKVLDCGLAKALDQGSGIPSTPLRAGGEQGAGDLPNSPTITSPAMTMRGTILGTAAYMSPEQAAGKTADKRSDLWSFGVVLLEMLTGQRVFQGESTSHVLAAVLTKDPDWTSLPGDTPAAIRKLLRRCLDRDRKRRIADAADARAEIDDALAPAATDVAPAARQRVWAPGIAGLAVDALAASLAMWALMQREPESEPVSRLNIALPANLPVTPYGLDRELDVAPDGSFVVYRSGSQGLLVIRRFDDLALSPIPGVLNARSPRVSPDGKWIVYFENEGSLRRVAMGGGPSIEVARLAGNPRGASWINDAAILAATANPGGVWRVPLVGGEPVAVSTPDRSRGEANHSLPHVLPGGRAALITVTLAAGEQNVAVLDIQTGRLTKVIQNGSDGRYLASGHLLFTSGSGLSVVGFDLQRLETIGDPVKVVDGASVSANGVANAAVTDQGTLVYALGGSAGVAVKRSLAWVDRAGREQPIPAPARAYVSARLSPDGLSIAAEIREQDGDIWLWNLGRQTLTRLTFETRTEMAPVWSHDGTRIVYSRQASQVAGAYGLYWKSADGTGTETLIGGYTSTHVPTAVTPDGRFVVGYQVRPATRRDLVQTPLGATTGGPDTSTATGLLETPFDERNGAVSPDGRFLAYQSDETGQFEIHVRPYPLVTSGRWQISTRGGSRPAWTRGGRELVFLDGADHMTAVEVDVAGGSLRAGAPATLFTTVYARPDVYRTYDVTPDGERFLVIKEAADIPTPTSLVVVKNWFDELRRLLPR